MVESKGDPETQDDWTLTKVIQTAGAVVPLAGYVYAIGWLVTWARLSAARLPVDSSLPMVDEKVILATGSRVVIVMAIVFGAMCAAAYAVHWDRWDKHADAWNDIVRNDRASAHERFLRREPRPQTHVPKRSTREERMVRVVAGFNVGVLSVTLGLVAGRLAKTLIDQWHPGAWWSLLAPWALCSLLAALVLGRVNPLRGNRGTHAALWLCVGVVAMFSAAPIGLLVLTWMGIGSFGRWYGKKDLPKSSFEFLRSPLPWLLLTIYALVAIAFYTMPPVSFSSAVVGTATGQQAGGYLGHTSAGVVLVACTPLADATSIENRVEFVPGDAVKSITTNAGQFTLDSGYRPSLPTLALRAFGIDAQTPAWIRPELKSRVATCAGMPPPRPRTRREAPELGLDVFEGPPPPEGRAHDGETPIEQTTPELAELAKRFQPTVLVTVADRFWPVSVGAVLEDIGSDGRRTCLHRAGGGCAVAHPTPDDLRPQRSGAGDYLEFPARPTLAQDPTGQFDAFLRGQRGLGNSVPSLEQWLSDPGVFDPGSTAQVYFFYAGHADPSRWPAPNHEIGRGFVALQYWFFYPYNYYPTVVNSDLMNGAPIAADVANTDLHQGDWEHVTVLVDPRTKQPRWMYTARHSNEGEYLSWNSPRLTFDEGHPVVQAAFGGHPTYEADCGARPRYKNGLKGKANDWLVCGSGRFAFRAQKTPLVDLAKTPWACWKGHFGVATPREVQAGKAKESSIQRAIDAYYHVAGPRSPLWQAENGQLSTDGAETESGFCAGEGDPQAPEREAISERLGR
jgi:hypothetical protein